MADDTAGSAPLSKTAIVIGYLIAILTGLVLIVSQSISVWNYFVGDRSLYVVGFSSHDGIAIYNGGNRDMFVSALEVERATADPAKPHRSVIDIDELVRAGETVVHRFRDPGDWPGGQGATQADVADHPEIASMMFNNEATLGDRCFSSIVTTKSNKGFQDASDSDSVYSDSVSLTLVSRDLRTDTPAKENVQGLENGIVYFLVDDQPCEQVAVRRDYMDWSRELLGSLRASLPF